MTTNREADELIELLDLNVPNPVLGQIDNVTGAALVEIAKRLIALEGVYEEPKPKLECWVNVYNGHISAYTTEDEANSTSVATRIRCVRMIEADDQ